MYVIDLPIYTMASKKKRFYLNLNIYRNAHFRVLDKAKKDFEKICRDLLKDIPPMGQVHLVYTFFAPSNQRSDTANVCCIVDKFFSDALVKCGILTDDNRDVVLSVLFRFGGVDPTNPRVEANLVSPAEQEAMSQAQPIENPLDLTKEDTRAMRLTIVETEIQTAIRAFIQEQITIKEGHVIDMEIRATRGDEGFIANIDIHPEGTPSAFATQTAVVAPKAAPAPAPVVAKPAAAKPAVTAPKAAATPAPVKEAAPAPEPDEPPAVIEEEPPFSPDAGIDETQREDPEQTGEPVGAAEPPEVQEPVVEAQERDLGGEGGAPLNKKPSIFAGLAKPVNTPKVTEAAEG